MKSKLGVSTRICMVSFDFSLQFSLGIDSRAEKTSKNLNILYYEMHSNGFNEYKKQPFFIVIMWNSTVYNRKKLHTNKRI